MRRRLSLLITLLLALSGCALDPGDTATERRELTDKSIVHGVLIPACGRLTPLEGQVFVLEDLEEIRPLGEVGGSTGTSHIFPTQHTHATSVGEPGGLYAPITITSPGELVVRSIVTTEVDGLPSSRIVLALCEDVYFYIDHVTELDPDFAAEVGAAVVTEYTALGATILDLALPVSTGQVLGVAHSSHAPDLGALDFQQVNAYVDPLRYAVDASFVLSQVPVTPSGIDPFLIDLALPQRVHAVCPYDYFSAAARATAFALNPRTAPPLCGEVEQDVPGTLEGSWFGDEGTFMSTLLAGDFESKAISFVHDAVDPSIPVIAVGTGLEGQGNALAPGVYTFAPSAPAFTSVTGGQVACYRDLIEAKSGTPSGFDVQVAMMPRSGGVTPLRVAVMRRSACTAPVLAQHIYER